jgi:16S rRNA (uracil1498-N3)-methyltransferase
MRLHRFFLKQNIGDGLTLEIFEERIVHQVRNVFRLEAGDRVIVFDGSGFDFESEITQIEKKVLNLKILERKKVFVPEKKLTLFMSIIRKENFELICEKATELGISCIVPVITDRTLAKNLNKDRIEKILIESAEQCGRGDVPIFGEVKKLEEVVLHEDLLVTDFDGISVSEEIRSKFNSVLVGPEGGWNSDEREMFHKKNITVVSLGNTVLRAETAGIVASALMLI